MSTSDLAKTDLEANYAEFYIGDVYFRKSNVSITYRDNSELCEIKATYFAPWQSGPITGCLDIVARGADMHKALANMKQTLDSMIRRDQP